MKNTIVICAVVFLLIVNLTEGLIFELSKKGNRCRNLPHPNNVTFDGNKSFIVLQDRQNKAEKIGIAQTLNKDPTVIKKRVHCICGFAACKCRKTEDPEKWYVKTFSKNKARGSSKKTKLCSCNYSLDDSILPVTFKTIGCTLPAEPIRANPPLASNLSHINHFLSRKKYSPNVLLKTSCKTQNVYKKIFKEKFSFRSDCLRCGFQCGKDMSGVLLKCVQCGPLLSYNSRARINFSNLIVKRKNKFKMHAKFLQIN